MIQIKISSKQQRYFLLLIIILLVCSSCYQDVFDLDLTDHQSQLVIEGIVSNEPGHTQVKISKTSNIFYRDSIRAVTGAIVNISDNEGNSEILREMSSGLYRAFNIIGSPGKEYYLNVLVNKKEYAASSKFPAPILKDSIKIIKENEIFPVYNLISYYSEHPGIEDYCLINFYYDGYLLYWDQILYSDKYTDGKKIVIDNLDSRFLLNDIVTIEVFTFDKPIYEYYSVLLRVNDYEDDEDPVLIDLASANPPSNISNNALGYFSAQHNIVYNERIRE